jgi:hypothetical protein
MARECSVQKSIRKLAKKNPPDWVNPAGLKLLIAQGSARMAAR